MKYGPIPALLATGDFCSIYLRCAIFRYRRFAARWLKKGNNGSQRVNYHYYSISPLIAGSLPLVLLFPSLFTIPLARQRLFYAAFFAWFQVEGVTLHFLDNVLRLHFALEPAQSILKRLAFLYANLCQENTPPTWPSAGIFKTTANPAADKAGRW